MGCNFVSLPLLLPSVEFLLFLLFLQFPMSVWWVFCWTSKFLLTLKTLADVYCPVPSTYWAGPREVVGFVVGPAHDRRSLVSMAYQEFLSLPHDHRDSWSYDHHYQQ